MKLIFVSSSLLVSLALACGSEPPDLPDGGVTDGGVQPLVPLAVGNRWTWQISDPAGGIIDTKVQTITGTAAYAGKAGFVFETVRDTDRYTRSLQIDDNGQLVRPEETELRGTQILQSFTYDPPAMRVDSVRTQSGTQFDESHTKTEYDATGTLVGTEAVMHRFFVEAESEIVDVPAGTFECVRIRRQRLNPPSEKTYWYAKGVGKVKETGGQTEELESYQLR